MSAESGVLRLVTLLLLVLAQLRGGSCLGQHKQQFNHQLHLTPCEIVWDSVVRVALAELSKTSNTNKKRYNDDDDNVASLSETALRTCYSKDGNASSNSSNNGSRKQQLAILTLVGFKGGSVADQINQDRAFITRHQYTSTTTAATSSDDIIDDDDDDSANHTFTVLGVMDGHGSAGHSVAEWSRHELLKRLPGILLVQQRRQRQQQHRDATNATGNDDDDDDDSIPAALSELLVAIDRDLPEPTATNGGATASFVLQVGRNNNKNSKLYFVNAGDSQSLLVAVVLDNSNRDATNNKNQQKQQLLLDVRVVFATQLHKPDDAVERARLEAVPGMWVVAASPKTDNEDEDGAADSARVWYTSPTTKGQYGLAMSRALGDREATGVIAEPTVTVLATDDVVADVVRKYNMEQQECIEISADGTTTTSTTCSATTSESHSSTTTITSDDVHLFVVSATDGLLDYLTLDTMAYQLAQALYEQKMHVLTAAESLLHQSSAQWQEEFHGQYRDDMAIAVAQIS